MAVTRLLICVHCGKEYHVRGCNYSCPCCRGPLLLPFCTTYIPQKEVAYDSYLGEGDTPLLSVSSNLSHSAHNLYLKVETGNPTGSFKDRGSALVAQEAKRLGYKKCAIASTGNAGASMAAYCSRMGLDLTVIVPANTAVGKLKQLHYYGATIQEVSGDFSMAETAYEKLISFDYYPAGPENPFRIEGIKSMAYEIVAQLDGIPDRVLVSIGTGGLMTSLFKGFSEMLESGKIQKMPRLDGVQLASVPAVTDTTVSICNLPKTVATGINISQPVMAKDVRMALKKSGGVLHKVDDQAILLAQRELAIYTGVGAEATGAVTMAAYKRGVQSTTIFPDEKVVIPITGHMLKE